MLVVDTLEVEAFTWVFIQAKGGKPEVVDLYRMEFPGVKGTKGVVLVHADLPLWAITQAVGHYRNRSRWQADYDPIQGGAIVFESFDLKRQVGDLIPLQLPCLACAQEGRHTELKVGADHPYCQQYGHQDKAPARYRYKRRGRPTSH